MTSAEVCRRNGPIRIKGFDQIFTSAGSGSVTDIQYSVKEMSTKLVWKSPIYDLTGLAEESRNFLFPLERRISNLRIDDQDVSCQSLLTEKDEAVVFDMLKTEKVSSPFIEVVSNSPDLFKRNELASYRIGRTQYGYSGLPAYWVDECNSMDEIWVPSKFCYDLFGDSGVIAEKLRIIPGSIDLKVFNPNNRASIKPVDTEPLFRFLAVIRLEKRDGWDILLESYVREFTINDPVELILRIPYPGRSLTEAVEHIQSFLRGLDIPEPLLPMITILEDSPLSKHQMSVLFAGSDVLVAPSRGEAFGRPLLEALACGTPVITTGWGGQTDFVTNDNGWLIDYSLRLIDNSDDLELKGKACAKPNIEHLRCCMRQALDSIEIRLKKGSHGPDSVAVYDRELVADSIVDQLVRIESENGLELHNKQTNKKQTASKPWVMITSPYAYCSIREYSKQLIESGMSEQMQLISCPDLFRTFSLDAELFHLQYHSAYVNPHQFMHHAPSGKLAVTIHDMHRFEEISNLFDIINVCNDSDYIRLKKMNIKDSAIVNVSPLALFDPVVESFEPSTNHDPVIAFHGYSFNNCGLKELIYSFAQFKRFLPSAKLLVIPMPNPFSEQHSRVYLENCERLIGELKLNDITEFVTGLSDSYEISSLLNQRSDMVVLPFLSKDGVGTTYPLRTALASVKPVITTDIGASGIATNEVFQFSIGQFPMLADLMISVWKNKAIQKTVVRNAIKSMQSNSLSGITRELLTAYKTVLADKSVDNQEGNFINNGH